MGIVSIMRDVTAEWQARATLERNERRARTLAEASSVLDRSLQAAHVIASITQLVVPELADLCAVVTVDQEAGSTELVDVASIDPVSGDLVRRALAHLALTDGAFADEPAGTPARRTDILLDPVPSELLDGWAAAHPEIRDELAALTLTSVMVVPLRASRRTLGFMLFSSLAPDRHFGQRRPRARARARRSCRAGTRERAAARDGAAGTDGRRGRGARPARGAAAIQLGLRERSDRHGARLGAGRLRELHRGREPGVLRADRVLARTSCAAAI